MKKRLLYILLFVSLFVTNAVAQELMVKSFGPSGTSLLASTQPKYDRNGVACAVLHVKIAVQGVKFYDDFIWDTPTEHVSEYTIYMVDGAKKIKVSAPGFLPLDVRFANYDKENYMLRSKNDYELVISIPSGNAQPADNNMSYFVLSVTPKDAIVEIDGATKTLSDGGLMELLQRGQHRYRITAAGYRPEEGSFTLGKDRLRKSVELKSSMASLTVKAATTGSAIYINEVEKDNDTWSGQLAAGNYIVEVRKQGYRTVQKLITLKDADEQSIDIPELEPVVGALDVSYTPLDAEVWLDGKRLGVSPDIFQHIPAGLHKVEVRKDGYVTESKDVEVLDGATVNLRGTLASRQTTKKPAKEKNTTPQQTAVVVDRKPTTKSGSSSSFYLEPGFSIGSPMGLELGLGAYFGGFNVELDAMLPMGTSEKILWDRNDKKTQTCTYSPSLAIGGRVGYAIRSGKSLRFVPQVGMRVLKTSEKNETSSATKIASEANCTSLLLAVKLQYMFGKNVGVSLTPEYNVAVARSEGFKALSDLAPTIKKWNNSLGAKLALDIEF